MKIGEILELSLTKSLAEIAKEHLSIGKGKARYGLKQAGCYSKNGVKGWFFDGDRSVLEQSIYDFVEIEQNRKPSPNVPTNEQKKELTKEQNAQSNDTNQRSNESNERSNVTEIRAKEEVKQAHEEVAPTKERTKEPKKERTNVTTNVIRKRSSFDMDVELMKDLKIQAIIHERTVYEIVETAVRQYLKELKKD